LVAGKYSREDLLAPPLARASTTMKRHKQLFSHVASFDALHAAYMKARRGKRYTPEALAFTAHLEDRLLELRNELLKGEYHTGQYQRFVVCEPKERLVAALPFRDRVVHHALCGVIEPIFERQFIADSYACRVGKGTHKAVDKLQYFLRAIRNLYGDAVWFLKADIAKCFPSIDHDILRSIITRSIGCKKTLKLIGEIIDSWEHGLGRGIPIGNLTSQLFANIYLNQIDQFVKHELKTRYYLRYMDDFVMLSGSKRQLHEWKKRIAEFTDSRLTLRLNSKTNVMPVAQGVNFCGYRTWWSHRLLRNASARRMRRKLKAFEWKYAADEIDFQRVNASVQSWLGHARHANTYKLRKKMFGQFTLGK